LVATRLAVSGSLNAPTCTQYGPPPTAAGAGVVALTAACRCGLGFVAVAGAVSLFGVASGLAGAGFAVLGLAGPSVTAIALLLFASADGVGAAFVSGAGFDSGPVALAVVLGSGAAFGVGAALGLGSGRAGGVDGAAGAGNSVESFLSVAGRSPVDLSLVDFSLAGLSASGLSITDGVVDVDGAIGDLVVAADRGGGGGFIQSST